MQQHTFRAMGCHMLAVVDRDGAQARAQLAAVPGWFEEWEQQLSRFRDDSDLARLNAAGRPTVVSPTLAAVIGVALRAAKQSDGLVRPTLLGAIEAAGYVQSWGERPTTNGEAAGGAPPMPRPASLDWRAIALDRRTNTVTLPAGVRIDLGGIAKGWAADQAAQRLASAGPALVDAGGDIAVSGPMADGSAWPVAIANPLAPEHTLGIVLIARGAVATSGRDYRRWQRGGHELHHIIDPRTGRSAETDVLTATVVAPDGPSAEVAAKVALILGSRDGLAWLDARPTFAGLLVLADGRVLRSRRMDMYLDLTAMPASSAIVAGAERGQGDR